MSVAIQQQAGCRLLQGAREEAAFSAVAALEAAPERLWLPLAAAVAPLLEASPPLLSLADTQRLLLRLQVRQKRHPSHCKHDLSTAECCLIKGLPNSPGPGRDMQRLLLRLHVRCKQLAPTSRQS